MFPKHLFNKYVGDDDRFKDFPGLFKGDNFSISFVHFTGSETMQRLVETLNEKKYRISDTDETYRIINHWAELALIEDNKNSRGQGWRHFSLVDLVWLQIVRELRRFGFPLEKIRIVREFMFPRIPKTGLYVPEFEFYLCSALSENQVYAAVFDNGSAELALQSELNISQQIFEEQLSSCLLISLSQVIQHVPVPALQKLRTKHSLGISLNEQELELLWTIQQGTFENIKVRMKNGKIKLIEAEESIDIKERIIDILKKGNYQDISVRQEGGKVVSVKRTVKQAV